jgi:hypothetical protein
MQWVEVQTAEALVEQEMEVLMEHKDKLELLAQAEAAEAVIMVIDLDQVVADHAL